MKAIAHEKILFILLLYAPVAHAQWADVGGGCFIENVAALLPSPDGSLLYVGGEFDSCGNNYSTRGFATWNGSDWNDLTGDYGSDYTFCIAEYNGNIYHGLISGAVFVGPQSEQNRVLNADTVVYSLAVFQNNLYAGGYFGVINPGTDSSAPMKCITYWNGNKWQALQGGIRSKKGDAAVRTMCVWNNALYVGGRFDTAGDIACNNLAKWDGSSWSAVGDGVSYADNSEATVTVLYVYNNQLAIGGDFNQAGNNQDVKNFVCWDGKESWTNMGIKVDGEVAALQSYSNALYLGGYFNYDESGNHLVQYENGNVTELGLGLPDGEFVKALTVWNGSLIVGGKFSQVGTLSVNNLASWTQITGIPSVSDQNVCYPNPAHNEIILKLNNTFPLELTISNELGQVLERSEVESRQADREITLNISTLPAGAYLLSAANDQMKNSWEFFKQ